jgi:hypothetical protein
MTKLLRFIAWGDLIIGIAGAALLMAYIPKSMARVGNLIFPYNLTFAIAVFIQGLIIFALFNVIAGAADNLQAIRTYGIDEPQPATKDRKNKKASSNSVAPSRTTVKAEPKSPISTLGLS